MSRVHGFKFRISYCGPEGRQGSLFVNTVQYKSQGIKANKIEKVTDSKPKMFKSSALVVFTWLSTTLARVRDMSESVAEENHL